MGARGEVTSGDGVAAREPGRCPGRGYSRLVEMISPVGLSRMVNTYGRC